MILTSCTTILPAVRFLFLLVVLVVMLSKCDSFSLSSLSDLESVVNKVSTIQRFGIVEYQCSYLLVNLTVILTSCTTILPAVLFLFLLVVLVGMLSKCDSFSLSSLSDLESVVKLV